MTVDVDAVLLLAGDPNSLYISATQVGTLSALYGDNVFVVAAATARAIAATFAASVTKKSGDVSINASDKYAHYMALAASLDKQAALRGLGATSAYAGGISVSDKDARTSDTDRTAPFFTRDLHDNPGNTNGTATWQ